MANDVIQAKYEQLDHIARLFSQNEESSKQILELLRSKTHTLRVDGWQGKGSDRFYSEMDEIVLPALLRLQAAMTKAAITIHQISDILREAEEVAARPFANHQANTTQLNNMFAYLGNENLNLASNLLGAIPWLGKGKPPNTPKPRPPVAQGYPHTADNLKTPNRETIENITKMINMADKLINHQTPESIALGNTLLQVTAMYTGVSYGVDITQASAFSYDPTFPKEGNTNEHLGVTFGPRALIDAQNNLSPSKLAATVFHEMIHVDQYIAHKNFGRRTNCPDSQCIQLYHVDEAEAYTMVLDNKKMLGVAKHDVADFEKRLVDEHIALLPANIQNMIKNREFEKARRLIGPGFRK